MFGGFTRRDQRARGELYLRGLFSDGKRKSMQPMGERLRVDHQQLRQFATTSTRDHVEVVAAVGGVNAGLHRRWRQVEVRAVQSQSASIPRARSVSSASSLPV